MAKKLLIGLIGLVAAFCIYASIQPGELKVSRETKINAPVDIVFGQVVDTRLYDAWNPWAKIDPNMKKTYEGPGAGVGAISRWDGNNQVGKGSLMISEAVPNQLVKMKLDFEKPIKNTATTDFSFRTEGNMTSVTWTFNATHGFVEKAIGVFMNMNKMMGDSFEQGLAQLKSIAEAKAAQAAAAAVATPTPGADPTLLNQPTGAPLHGTAPQPGANPSVATPPAGAPLHGTPPHPGATPTLTTPPPGANAKVVPPPGVKSSVPPTHNAPSHGAPRPAQKK